MNISLSLSNLIRITQLQLKKIYLHSQDQKQDYNAITYLSILRRHRSILIDKMDRSNITHSKTFSQSIYFTCRCRLARHRLPAQPNWYSDSDPWCRKSYNGCSSAHWSAIVRRPRFPTARIRKHLKTNHTCAFWIDTHTRSDLSSSSSPMDYNAEPN